MRGATIQYLNKEIRTISIRNNNTASALLDGQPVFFDGNNVSNVYLGVDVKNYEDSAAPRAMHAGIVKTDKSAGLAVGEVGEAVCYGFTDAIVVRRVRADSTNSWPTCTNIAVGDILVPETANHFLTWSATSPAIGAALPVFAAAESFVSKASIDTQGATGSNNNTVAGPGALKETVRMKVFVRAM